MQAIIVFISYYLHAIKCACLTQQTDLTINYAINGDFAIPNLHGGWRATTGSLYGWSANAIEQGAGKIYNSNWPSSWQVIELDVYQNEMYNQTVNLTQSKFLFTISYAARKVPLNSSGMRIWWNG